jgi:hypothetical protein
MNPGQLDLLEYARLRRDDGMAMASQAQDETQPNWSQIAYQAIENIARRQVHIHIDHVLCAGVPQPHHPNAWGSVWMRAIRNGIIQRSSETRPCTVDPIKNAHRYPVYFSRIYDPRTA